MFENFYDRIMLNWIKFYNLEFCEHYIFCKYKRVWFGISSSIKSSYFLQIINYDIIGPVPTQSLSGGRYFQTFIDDYSRRAWVYFMKINQNILRNLESSRHEQINCWESQFMS